MSPPLRVAYIITPVTFGGAEKVSLNFLTYLDRKQIELHLIMLVRPWERPPVFLDEVERLGISYSTLEVAKRPGKDPFRVIRVIWALYRKLRKQTFDVMHTHGYFADICGLPIAKLLRIPALSSCHGFIDMDRKVQLYNQLDFWALKLCSCVIAVSDELRANLEKHGIDKNKIRVVTNAVSVPELIADQDTHRENLRREHNIPVDAFMFVFVGRLSEEKGLMYLLEAFAPLVQDNDQAQLVLIGEGPQRETLAQRVKELDLQKHAFLAGFQEQISPWLEMADCFVLPSLTEGTPMALLEAMAAGRAIIATQVGGVPRVITSGVNGALVPSADVSALEKEMVSILAQPDLREKYGAEARRTIESNYSILPWCQKILDIYRSIGAPVEHQT